MGRRSGLRQAGAFGDRSDECEALRRILGATCRWPGGDLDDDEILRRIDIDGLAEDAERGINAGRRDPPLIAIGRLAGRRLARRRLADPARRDDARAARAAALHHEQPEPAVISKRHIETAAADLGAAVGEPARSEEHTSELQSLMRISYAVFCLKKKTKNKKTRARNARQE